MKPYKKTRRGRPLSGPRAKLHLDMGSCQSETVEGLKGKARTMLQAEATLLYQTGCLTIKSFRQIDERNYAEMYDFAGKTVKKLGISFSSEKRTVVDVKIG